MGFSSKRDSAASHIFSSLTEMERKVLGMLNRKLLVSVEELTKAMKSGEFDGAESALNRLQDEGFINIVEPLGKSSYVITQKGMRALKG